jgi:succinate-semialdehyde dehydrogenase/glutarate-semialdehyde dehydrogenase
MKRGAFELGGSDPCIIYDDADLELTVNKSIGGRLHTNGQACNNHKRFLIHDKIYDDYVDLLLKKLEKHVKIGDPLDPSTTIGPLSMEK